MIFSMLGKVINIDFERGGGHFYSLYLLLCCFVTRVLAKIIVAKSDLENVLDISVDFGTTC